MVVSFALLQHAVGSRVCASIGMSPISSRNRVPLSACSKRPALRELALVKAPFS